MLHKFSAFHFEVKFAHKRVQWLKVYYWCQISFFLETKNSVELKSPSTWLVFIIAPLDCNLCCYKRSIKFRQDLVEQTAMVEPGNSGLRLNG